VCVCGDFYLVRRADERKLTPPVFTQVDADMFNKFIHDSLLIDLPICGHLYTWFKGDGVSMSRLDSLFVVRRGGERVTRVIS
jgi:hypothetical protein